MKNIAIKAIPILESNYIWLIISDDECVAVDPGDARAVVEFCIENKLKLKEIIITHKHLDHTGGVADLLRAFPYLKVSGNLDSCPQINHHIRTGTEFRLLGSIKAIPYNLKGHTDDLYVYHLPELSMMFTGDLLFAGGCGRVFEGSYINLYESFQFLLTFPMDTAIYPAHEYSLGNMKFAALVDPENHLVSERLREFEQKYKSNQMTLPTSLDIEIETNPFFRTKDRSMQMRIGITNRDQVETFGLLRAMKSTMSLDEVKKMVQGQKINVLDPI